MRSKLLRKSLQVYKRRRRLLETQILLRRRRVSWPPHRIGIAGCDIRVFRFCIHIEVVSRHTGRVWSVEQLRKIVTEMRRDSRGIYSQQQLVLSYLHEARVLHKSFILCRARPWHVTQGNIFVAHRSVAGQAIAERQVDPGMQLDAEMQSRRQGSQELDKQRL